MDLIGRMAAGDETALGTFYDRWSTLVHSVALQVLSDADDAEEVVEETFWQVWRQAGRYEGGRGAVSTWLAMIARSRALDRRRARRQIREESWGTVTESLSPVHVPATGDPLQDVEWAERREMLMEALLTLPLEQQEAVRLAYFGGMSQSEMAAHTGQPLGTIKTRVRLALRKLKEQLSVFSGTIS
jgi:RNA polymerase sigma-70 factor (ECF subfamily)